MIRVVVNVMLKPEILDPQGQAIAHALPRLGFGAVASVRQGKRFEIELDEQAAPTEPVEPTELIEPIEPAESTEPIELIEPIEPAASDGSTGPTETDGRAVPAGRSGLSEEDALAMARQIAETLLANPVIEDFEVRVVQ